MYPAGKNVSGVSEFPARSPPDVPLSKAPNPHPCLKWQPTALLCVCSLCVCMFIYRLVKLRDQFPWGISKSILKYSKVK